jgi:hypothetical protein
LIDAKSDLFGVVGVGYSSEDSQMHRVEGQAQDSNVHPMHISVEESGNTANDLSMVMMMMMAYCMS